MTYFIKEQKNVIFLSSGVKPTGENKSHAVLSGETFECNSYFDENNGDKAELSGVLVTCVVVFVCHDYPGAISFAMRGQPMMEYLSKSHYFTVFIMRELSNVICKYY